VQERDLVWRVLKIAADLSGALERLACKDLAELQQTIYAARSSVSSFVSQRAPDPSFDICMQSLRVSLEHCERLVSVLDPSTLSLLSKGGNLIEMTKLDFLIKQKVDQMDFLFVQRPLVAPAHKITDGNARSMWISAFGEKVTMVPWEEFWPVFNSASMEDKNLGLVKDDDDGEDIERQTMQQFVDFTLDGWVSVYELEIFLKSFGPLQGSCRRLLEPFQQVYMNPLSSSRSSHYLFRAS